MAALLMGKPRIYITGRDAEKKHYKYKTTFLPISPPTKKPTFVRPLIHTASPTAPAMVLISLCHIILPPLAHTSTLKMQLTKVPP
jgi:hypothetical protein